MSIFEGYVYLNQRKKKFKYFEIEASDPELIYMLFKRVQFQS